MPDLTNDEQKAILGEILSGQLQAIFEYVKDIPQIKRDVAELKQDMTVVKQDIKVMRAVMKALGYQVDDHETRIKRLEKAA